ncbi:AMP-binding protein, partial [uncultured Caballeronia sp.]|uniref:AMP-binding protein n=1 Tax=uncultured Caballeronia sp. TaxID=1827198 RepID=UPI001574FE5A
MSKQLNSKTLPELVRELAKKYPDREAIVDGDRRVTFRGLHHAVENCARGLMSIGAGPGDKIAILMGNRLEWVVTSLAATYIGGVAVAINTWYTPPEIAHAMNHSDARYLACTPSYMKHDYVQTLERLRAEGRLPLLQAVVGIGQSLPPSWYEWDALCAIGANSQAVFDGTEPDAEDVAFVLYTSGSTSQPKGVQLVHRGLIENIWNIGERQQATEHDRLWLAVSL